MVNSRVTVKRRAHASSHSDHRSKPGLKKSYAVADDFAGMGGRAGERLISPVYLSLRGQHGRDVPGAGLADYFVVMN